MTAVSNQPIFRSFKDKFFKEIYEITTLHELELVKAEKSRGNDSISLYIQRPESSETILGLEFDFSTLDKITIKLFPNSSYTDDSSETIVNCLEDTSVQNFLNKFRTLLEEGSYRSTLSDLPIEPPKL